jgi:hypothetical protein
MWPAVAAAAADAVTLRQRYAPGRYLMTADWTTTQTTSLAGRPQPPRRIKQLLVMRLTVAAANARGVQEIAIDVVRVRHEVHSGGRKISYDSAAAPERQDPDLARALKLLSRARATLAVGPGGRPLSAGGLDAVWDSAARQELLPAELARRMRQRIGDRKLLEIFRARDALLPERSVAVGDTWSGQAEMHLAYAGEVTYDLEAKLDSLSDGAAVLSFTAGAESDTPARADVMGVNLVSRQYRLKQSGTATFDTRSGMLTATSVDQTTSMQFDIKAPDGTPTAILLTQKATAATKLKREAAPAPTTRPARPAASYRPGRKNRLRTGRYFAGTGEPPRSASAARRRASAQASSRATNSRAPSRPPAAGAPPFFAARASAYCSL